MNQSVVKNRLDDALSVAYGLLRVPLRGKLAKMGGYVGWRNLVHRARGELVLDELIEGAIVPDGIGR